jgi:hypothetical protein
MADPLNPITSRVGLLASYLLLISGLSQIVIGSYIGPMSVGASTIPMTKSFSPNRTNDQLVLHYLHIFAGEWRIVFYSGLFFTAMGCVALIIYRVTNHKK